MQSVYPMSIPMMAPVMLPVSTSTKASYTCMNTVRHRLSPTDLTIAISFACSRIFAVIEEERLKKLKNMKIMMMMIKIISRRLLISVSYTHLTLPTICSV
eukprot:TRINITY_DN910_c0_g1_i18.p4 TRINITY_DN910_c0_g1~~TRINITY_DN910_c0_g1_i18.p4  ORF type:complete len:100 (-),score=23.11 TRINITY_DN910_c0_g1_i18:41-340(-)